MRYTTELTAPVWFYLRGEEYSAQIDDFVAAVAGRGDARPERLRLRGGDRPDDRADARRRRARETAAPATVRPAPARKRRGLLGGLGLAR